MDAISLVISSCDSHSDAWSTFFYLLHRMWSDLQYPIYIIAESKEYQDDNIRAVNPLVGENSEKKTWSWIFKRALKRIESEYVIVLLEDYFLESEVDTEELEKCVSFMQNNTDVACITFRGKKEAEESKELSGYRLVEKGSLYRADCQASIWRKECLLKLLRDHEDAWRFEHFGSKRTNRYAWRFYKAIGSRVFDYDGGDPIFRGYWNMKSIRRIEEKVGISIDTSGRDRIESRDELPKRRRDSIIRRIAGRIRSSI